MEHSTANSNCDLSDREETNGKVVHTNEGISAGTRDCVLGEYRRDARRHAVGNIVDHRLARIR